MISTCEQGQTRRSAPTEAPPCRGNPVWLPLARRGRLSKIYRIGTYQLRGQNLQLPPLLQVPPASRREPRTGSVPPARRGNLKEGVFSRACFCKLCPRDWYHTTCGRRRRLVAGVAGGERTATGARNAARRCAPAVAGGDRGDSERDTRSPSDTSCLGRPAPVHMGRTGTLKAGQDKRGAPAPLRAAGRRGFSRGSAEAVRIYRLFLRFLLIASVVSAQKSGA